MKKNKTVGLSKYSIYAILVFMIVILQVILILWIISSMDYVSKMSSTITELENEISNAELQMLSNYNSGYSQAIKDCTPQGFDQNGKLIITFNGEGHIYEVNTKEVALSLIPFL